VNGRDGPGWMQEAARKDVRFKKNRMEGVHKNYEEGKQVYFDAPIEAGEDVHEEGQHDHQNGHLADRWPHHVRKLVFGHAG
jgi:hypothetical protein